MANEDRLKLFKAIGKAGYDIGNYDDFDRRMNNPEDRQKFYTAVNEAGFDIGPQEDFERRISPSKYKITVDGNDVQVSEKEYLDFLKRHPSGTNKPQTQPQPKPQQPQVQANPQQASKPSTVPSAMAPVSAETSADPISGTPWNISGNPGQVRTNEQHKGIGYNAPFRQDLTVAQHAEIERMNDYAVRQLQKREDEEKRRSQPLIDTGSPEANKHIVRTQGDWEDDVQQGVNRITSSVVAPAVDKAIAEFDKKASEVFNEGRENTNAVRSIGQAGGFSILGNVRESNEAKDPEKILGYLQQQMEDLYKDSAFAEEVGKEADRMGIDRTEYIENIIKPKIQQDLADRLTDTLVKRELPKSTVEYIMNGLGNSIVGMLYNTVTESKGQRQIKNQAEAMTEEGLNPYYNPGTGAKLTQMGVSFAADAPFFGLYGKVSGQVAKKVAERQIQNLMGKGLSETAARSIVGAALENSVGARMKNYLMQHVISSSLTMGGYNATSEAARQMRDSEFDPMRLAGSTAEGLATGAAFGVTGAVSQALSQPLTGISRVGAKAAGFVAEAETMYATEELAKMVQGEEGFTNPFEGSLEAMEKLGVMKASGGHLLTKTFETGADIYKNGVRQAIGKAMFPKQTGMKFTKEEETYVRDTAEGRSLLETLSNMHPDAAFSEVNGKKKLTPEGEKMRRQLADNYNAFMGNTEIPAVVKQKVAGVLGGVYRPGLETGADIVHNADGSVIVKTRDKDGNCVRDLKFDTFSDAEQWREMCKDEFRLNDAVNMWNGTSQEQRAAVVMEIAEANGISAKDAADLVHKALDSKDTSLDRDQYNNVYDVIARNAFPEDEYNPKRRFEEGRKITPEERHFALADAQVAEEALAQYGQEFADEVMASAEYPDEKMAELAMRKDVTGPMLDAAKEYYNANARMQGMMEEALKGVDEQVEAANTEVRRNTHPDSGMMISGSSRGRNVYVTAGHFQITPEGKLVSTDNSGAVIVRDMNTGEIDVINPNDVVVTGVTDPRRLIEANDSMDGLRGQLLKAADDSIEFAPGTPETPQEMGEVFTGTDGRMYMVTGETDQAGNVAWMKLELDENGNPIGEPQPLDIDEYRKSKSNEIDAANRPQDEVVSENQEMGTDINEPVPEGQINGPIETPETPLDEVQQPEIQQEGNGKEAEQQQSDEGSFEKEISAKYRIPLNENAEPDYEKAKPEDTFDALVEEFGEEYATALINSEISDAQRRIPKPRPAEPITIPNGLTMAEKARLVKQQMDRQKNQQEADRQAKEKEQTKIDYWNSVLEIPKKRKAEAERAARLEKMQTPEGRAELLSEAKTTQQRAEIAKEVYGEYFNENVLEPDTPEELVSLLLPYGKLNWEGYERGVNHVRGLQEELGSQHTRGLSKDKGTSGFNAYLAKKGEGESLDEIVHDMYIDNANLVGEDHRFTTEEIKDAVISMLLSAEKSTDIRDYTINSRIERAEKAIRGELEREAEAAEVATLEEPVTDEPVQTAQEMPFEAPTDEVLPFQKVPSGKVEVDQEGKPFINASNGTTTFGMIDASRHLDEAPIKLSQGDKNHGYEHMELRHGDQIRSQGFKSVEEFVEFVANNYNVIKEGVDEGGNPNGTYLLQVVDNHNNTVYIELSKDGSYWNVNSGGVFRKNYGNKLKTVWSASEVQNRESAPDSTLRSTSNADKTIEPNGTVPDTVFEGKDTKNINTIQEKKEKSDENFNDHKVEQGNPAFDSALQKLDQREISIDDPDLLKEYGLKNVTLSRMGDHVTLTHFVVDNQGQGNGTRFMEDLARLADEKGWTLDLTPDTSFGATSVKRLKDFYKRFGFKDNKGRNTDFFTRESMVRRPKDWQPRTPEQQEQALRDAVVDHLRQAGIEVSTDWKEGQRILDDYNSRMAVDDPEAEIKPQKVDEGSVAQTVDMRPIEERVVRNPNIRESLDIQDEVAKLTPEEVVAAYKRINEQMLDEEGLNIDEHEAKVKSDYVSKHGIKGVGQAMADDFNAQAEKYGFGMMSLRWDLLERIENEGLQDMLDQKEAASMQARVFDMHGRPMLFKTKDGHAYGYTYKGKIYLDPRIAMSETPVHEYGHLWAEMKRQTNPEEWDDIKRVMLTDKLVQPIIDRVKRDYPELFKEGREDDFIEEVITQFSGNRGAERLREIANEIAAENGGIFGKAEAVTAMQRLKNILNRFWEGVAKMMGWKYRNANQIADRILADMLNDVNPAEKIKKDKVEMKPQKEDTAARDKEYADAVAAGDKEKVDAMLREEAARKGYDENSDYQGTTAFNGSAPSKNDYFDTKEERKEAFENGSYDGTASLGDFMDSGIDLGNLDWTIHDWRGYHTASSAGKESIMNLRYTVDGKKKTITMYRSVPSSVKENSFRNGDWVTPSLQYAKDNAAVHGWGRKYRIIKQEVPVDDIWWDNNDINEWGYDNGKDYAYKNTKNNRKLMEPTYDDKGNLIPLSKRFNDRNADIKFQMVGKKGAAEADKADWFPQRTEDMNLAEEMEKAEKDANAIKMATGWERGADGQWRYEIPDADADILSKYKEKIEEAKARGVKDPTVMVNLEELLGKDSELFKYYPNLRNMAVIFSKDLHDGTSGSYDGVNIKLNAKETSRFDGDDLNNESIYGTLLHEVQHAIQDIEGFAKGGSLQTSTTYEGINAILSKKRAETDRLYEEIEADYKILDSEEELDLAAQLDGRSIEDERQHIKDEIDSLSKRAADISAQINKIKNTKAPSMTDAKDLYHRLAGEVESRNVTERMDMTPDERRNSLASETEDVRREDQVVITDDGTSDSSSNSSPIGKTSSPEAVQAEESRVNTSPTDAQKEAGNYQKGHINIDGYDITIENPKGSVRSGVDSKGNRWESTMHNTYGYIRGTEGVDGDHIDVFLSDNPASGNVYVIDQVNPDTGEFDEHKIVYGYATEEEARQAYLSNYGEGWKGLGNITEVSREEFKKWIESSHHKTKPFTEYRSVKANEPRFQRVSSPEPEMTLEERQYWNKWDADMKKWRERNAIEETATGPSEKPKMQQGESALNYAKRLVQWNRERSLWQTAPKLEDYRQKREDKDVLEAARENEQRYPDSPSAKMRRVAAEFQQIRRAMSQQKAYDKATVKAVTDFAQEFMKMGFGDNLGRGDVERLLSSVKNATGASDIKKHVDNIMRILTDNYLKNLKAQVNKLASVKELKQTAQGVDKQGKLELKGQRMIQAFREAAGAEFVSDVDDLTRSTAEVDAKVGDLRDRLAKISENMEQGDPSMWEEEYEGVSLALQYFDNIARSQATVTEYKKLREDAVKLYKGSGRDYKAQQELLESYDKAIEDEKISRIGMYGDMINRLHGNILESMKGAREFNEKKRERVKWIHTLAARDMDGIDADTDHEQTWKTRLNNSAIPRLFLGPTATFEQMLKSFGRKNANGEGWLYNEFMRGYIDSVDREQAGREEVYKALDSKVSEIFGKKMRLSDLYGELRNTKKYPEATVEWLTADGEMKKHTLSQGQMLDIYMWNKQPDGAVKLREQGITEEKVTEIKNALDPKLIQLADWFQGELSPKLREKYSKVYERVFGAAMPAVENYFPLRIIGDSITRDIDVTADPNSDNVLPSNTTGAIIRRKVNTKPLDILGTDAVSLMIEHVDNMEKWAAFVEWYEDINALLSYNRFKNQVKNSGSIYGSGDKQWENFRKAAQIAAGTYRPTRSEADKAITTIASGVTGAKIAFRPYTALKQLLSAPAFMSDASAEEFAKCFMNPKNFWYDNIKWAMENLPALRKRWHSRDLGDTRLMDTTGWGYWDTKVRGFMAQYGMAMNGAVDVATCAAGARAIYRTRLERYRKQGMSDEQANKRALQDAEIGYNLTQQSSEGAFVSAVQKDRTLFANMWSVFRNSSMAYTRQSVDAVRNLRHLVKYKGDSIEFMKRQLEAEGLSSEEAQKAASEEYRRAYWHNAVKLAVSAWVLPIFWELGSKVPYLALGGDDEEKKDMVNDVLRKELVSGPGEGLMFGQAVNGLWGAASSRDIYNTYKNEGFGKAAKEGLKQMAGQETSPLPLFSDMGRLLMKFSKDEAAGLQDMVNLAVQMGTGLNPQTITDPIVAAIDATRGDLGLAKETELFLLRLLMVPEESAKNIYIDEVGMTADKAKKLSFDEAAERYAKYKTQKGAPFFSWMYDDDGKKKRRDSYVSKFTEDVRKRIDRLNDEELLNTIGRTRNPEEKALLVKMAKKRLGISHTQEEDGKKPKQDKDWYQKEYSRMMDGNDLREDELLSSKLKGLYEDYNKKHEEAAYKSAVDEMDFYKANKGWKERLDKAKEEISKRLDWIRDGKYDSKNGRPKKTKDASSKQYDLLYPGKRDLVVGDDKNNEAVMKNIRKWRKEALEILMRAESSK